MGDALKIQPCSQSVSAVTALATYIFRTRANLNYISPGVFGCRFRHVVSILLIVNRRASPVPSPSL